MTFVMDHEAGYKGRYENYSENEEDCYGTCTFTTNEMVGAIKEIFRDLPFTPTLVQGEDDGIPDAPTLCFSLDEVKAAVLEITETDKAVRDFPNYREEIMAAQTIEEIDNHDVLINWESYNSMVRFFYL